MHSPAEDHAPALGHAPAAAGPPGPEGLRLRARWRRAGFVAFDEMRALEGGAVALDDGTRRRVPAAARPAAARGAVLPPDALCGQGSRARPSTRGAPKHVGGSAL